MLFAEGVIARPIRGALAFSPPLIITEAQVDELFDKVGRALDRTAEHVGVAGRSA